MSTPMLSTMMFKIGGADHLFDDGLRLRHFLLRHQQLGSRRSLEVDHELPRVGLGKVREAQQAIQTQAENKDDSKADQHHRRPAEHLVHPYFIARQHLLEVLIEGGVEARSETGLAAFEGARLARMGFAEAFRVVKLEVFGAVQRHHGHGNDVRGEERHHNRQRHGRKEKLADP